MSLEISIPKLGITMEEGTIAEWLVANGESVAAGQPIYVVETDKVESEIEAPVAGVIALIGEPGVTYPVGTVIAAIG